MIKFNIILFKKPSYVTNALRYVRNKLCIQMSWLELFPGWCVRIYGVSEEIFCWNMEYARVISWGMQNKCFC